MSKLVLCSTIISPLPKNGLISYYKYCGKKGEQVGSLINCSPFQFSEVLENELDEFQKEIAVNVSFNFNFVYNNTYSMRYFYVDESKVKIYNESDIHNLHLNLI